MVASKALYIYPGVLGYWFLTFMKIHLIQIYRKRIKNLQNYRNSNEYIIEIHIVSSSILERFQLTYSSIRQKSCLYVISTPNYNHSLKRVMFLQTDSRREANTKRTNKKHHLKFLFLHLRFSLCTSKKK
jgi:hypothetical protein